MKLRWLACALAVAGFSAAPWIAAQTTGQNPQTQTPQTQNPQTQNPPSHSPQQAPTTDPDDGQPKASDIQNAPKKPPAALPTQDDSSIKHDGGKHDVDAIGNRNVGCGRGVGNWYSVEKQVAMGRSFAQQVESQVKMVNDPVVTEYINRIGQNLVRNSDAQVPFTIKVIDSDVVNAMALPGGFFYVNSGLILAADEEAEVAGVMAHEIAHVAACHAAREQTRASLIQMASIPFIFVGGGIGYAGYEAAGIGGMFGILKFSRGFEAEADYLGIEYMYRAGYDPSAFVSFFEKVQAMEKKKPGTLAKAFDTHPQNADRIAKSQDEIRTILPAKPQYVVTTSEFDDVKARLAALENKHKLLDQKDASKPSLRRTSNTTDKSDSKKDDDDRPTLKRRDDSN
ncbi:MAG TPA: M48 family metalloprotease [Candidatus Binatia bacterium]|nr:M48 family metalloprotease [Candidatus Binatia bacterium]